MRKSEALQEISERSALSTASWRSFSPATCAPARRAFAIAAAAELAVLIESFGAEATAETVKPGEASEEARRAVDPVALAALIVSIPPAVLAVIEIGDRIADRMEKRRRANQLLGRARQILKTGRVEIHIAGKEGARSLLALSPNDLLDLAEAKARGAISNP